MVKEPSRRWESERGDGERLNSECSAGMLLRKKVAVVTNFCSLTLRLCGRKWGFDRKSRLVLVDIWENKRRCKDMVSFCRF